MTSGTSLDEHLMCLVSEITNFLQCMIYIYYTLLFPFLYMHKQKQKNFTSVLIFLLSISTLVLCKFL